MPSESEGVFKNPFPYHCIVQDAERLEKLIRNLALNDFREIILESSNTRLAGDMLIWLDLGCKDLVEIPPGTFDGFHNLEYLGLYGNQIKELPRDIFADLPKLRILDIGENRLRTLPEEIFKNNTQLEYLWIYSNDIEELPPGIFERNVNLRELILNSNKLTGFNFEYVENLQRLEILEIALNRFNELDHRLLTGLPQLKKLVFNKIIDGNLHIINYIDHEKKEVPYENRIDEFVLVTGVMGSGKSTIMSQYTGVTVNPKIPPVGKNILYDNLFGIEICEGFVANFFEIDGPTVTSWTKFIEIARRVILVVNYEHRLKKLDKINHLINHVLKYLGKDARLVIILNNYTGSERPELALMEIVPVSMDNIDLFTLEQGHILPDIGGLQKVIMDQDRIWQIFRKILDDIEVTSEHCI